MKKIFLFLFLITSTIGVAQNSGITYQAVIYGPNGQQLPGTNNQQYILANKTICLQFSIIDHQGVVEYQETIVTTTDKFGMVNLLIGTGNQVGGYATGFNGITWNVNTKSLKVELDTSQNCQNFIQISNNPFTYVPFAYYSANPGEPGPPGPQGPPGTNGTNGIDGLSAYQIWLNSGNTGTEVDFIASLQGVQGPAGTNGTNGTDGLSAYQIWINNGNSGTEADFIASLQGAQGPAGATGATGPAGVTGPQGPAGSNGIDGVNGTNGTDGLSAYQIWINNGNTGTEADFIASLQGVQGPAGTNGTNGTDGLSAYQIWLNNGNTGTEADFISSLQGAQGPQGIQGPAGATGPQGIQGEQGPIGLTGATGPQGIQGPAGLLSNGSSTGNTPYWNGTQWVVNNSNIYNNGAGVGIGTDNPNTSAKLDISSSTQGFLPPRMTTTQRDAITSPAIGLVIYNTSTNCLNFFIGSGWNETCGNPILPSGTVTTINCGSATNNGTLTQGTASSGVNSVVPYTGGNGGSHSGQTVTSTGVTGLTATLSSGTFASGTGTLTYTITGTPASSGTASFAINIGGQTCTLTITVANNLVVQYPAGSVFCASGPTAIVDVTNPVTGKTWMDRNLGASQVATSSTDALAYGDLYQWGRASDGHQCRNSFITNVRSSTDVVNNSNFIYTNNSPYDWRSPSNDNLWQGINGINNPCPTGYRIPTYSELFDELNSWTVANADGAFNSPLKLTLAGNRDFISTAFENVGSRGTYWSSSVFNGGSYTLVFQNGATTGLINRNRSSGITVRCIKN